MNIVRVPPLVWYKCVINKEFHLLVQSESHVELIKWIRAVTMVTGVDLMNQSNN